MFTRHLSSVVFIEIFKMVKMDASQLNWAQFTQNEPIVKRAKNKWAI